MKLSAYSLPEMLAVVAIVGVLMGVGVPSYQKHVKQTDYVNLVQFAQGLTSEVSNEYSETGSFPASLFNTNVNTDTAVSEFPEAEAFHYNVNSGLNAAWWGFRLLNKSNEADLFVCVRVINDVLETYCGAWGTASNADGNETRSYLPASCQDSIATACNS